jgi:hypothetical protein
MDCWIQSGLNHWIQKQVQSFGPAKFTVSRMQPGWPAGYTIVLPISSASVSSNGEPDSRMSFCSLILPASSTQAQIKDWPRTPAGSAAGFRWSNTTREAASGVSRILIVNTEFLRAGLSHVCGSGPPVHSNLTSVSDFPALPGRCAEPQEVFAHSSAAASSKADPDEDEMFILVGEPFSSTQT